MNISKENRVHNHLNFMKIESYDYTDGEIEEPTLDEIQEILRE